jgi:glycosyltransferase involved in cell wall biosynthesis
MKVSIVIPCYNEKHTIENIVEAVCNTPLKSREIIVVDDCSVDGTQAVAVLQERVSQLISYSGCTYAEGKKINWKDGAPTIYAIFKYNLERGRV